MEIYRKDYSNVLFILIINRLLLETYLVLVLISSNLSFYSPTHPYEVKILIHISTPIMLYQRFSAANGHKLTRKDQN